MRSEVEMSIASELTERFLRYEGQDLRADHRGEPDIDRVEMGDEADARRARMGAGLAGGDGGVVVDDDVG